MKIVPDSNIHGSHKTGMIVGYTADEISKILGFDSNVLDDAEKVVNSWGFQVNGKDYAIWDYKGSQYFNTFSTFGSKTVFDKLFPLK
jgi:hypothetical protein